MRDEDFTQLESMHASLLETFGIVSAPDAAIPRILIAIAALGPIGDTLRDERFVGAEWLTPSLIDAFEQAGAALATVYDELESALDEVAILEPGTITEQNLVDLPLSARNPARVAPGHVNDRIPRPAGAPRGELIR